MIKVKKLIPDAIIPQRGRSGDACYDLYTSEEVFLRESEGKVLAPTGIALELPVNYEAEIRPRSGISLKGLEVKRLSDDVPENVDVDVIQGTIDSNYRGEINIIIRYSSFYQTYIPKGTKLAQMKINYVPDTELIEVEELSDSNRGTKGFGSSGV